MKKKLPVVVVGVNLLALTFFAVNCQKSPQVSGPITAELISMKPKDPSKANTDEPEFELKKVTFTHLDDLNNLTGKYYEFFSGGRIKNIESRAKLQEIDVSKPGLYYSVSNNVVIPKDNYTLGILSTAYQMDKIVANLKANSGIDPDTIHGIKGKFKLYYHSAIGSGKGNAEENNACYMPGIFSFATYKTNKEEKIPLSANLSVMAHEFGHLLFDYLLAQFKHREALESEIFRGTNEGIADIFGFTNTGETNVLAGSFEVKDHKHNSMRNFAQVNFDTSTIRKCSHGFYCYGILFANAYLNAMKESNLDPKKLEDRQTAFKWLAQGLKTLGEELEQKGNINGVRVGRRIYIENSFGAFAIRLTFVHMNTGSPEQQKFAVNFVGELEKNFKGVL